MKRWLFIVGIVIILILAGVWAFLLFAPEDTKTDIYNRFGFTGSQEEGVIDTIVDAILPDLKPDYVPLRQLTTRRVAGYVEIALASSSPQVYFVEAGTGHIYSLNLQNGVEAKISNTTIAGARVAHISKNGTFAVIQSGSNVTNPLTILPLSGTSTSAITVDEPVLDFTITDDDQLLYTTTATEGVVGKVYDIESQTSRTIFTTPLRQVSVAWGSHSEKTQYITPKPARTLESFLYESTEGKLSRTNINGYGLVVLPTDKYILYTKSVDNDYVFFIQNKETGNDVKMDTPFFPEKCTVSSFSIAYCGQNQGVVDGNFPDNWYRGEVSFADEIWAIDLDTQEAKVLINTLDVSGREIDMVHPNLSKDEMSLYFKNKNDYTLWVYDIVAKEN